MFEDLSFPVQARILEVGCCDTGRWAAWAAQRVPQGSVLAVDQQLRLVKMARLRFPEREYPNLQFLISHPGEMKGADAGFDLVLSDGMYPSQQPDEMIQALARLVRPGGRLALSCQGPGSFAHLYRSLAQTMQEPRWTSYFLDWPEPARALRPLSPEAWLAQAGLYTLRSQLRSESIDFPGREAFQEWLQAKSWRRFSRLPGLRREEFFCEVVDRYCHRARRTGIVRAFCVRVRLEAWKPPLFE